MQQLPFGLVLFRLIISPIMIWVAWMHVNHSGIILATLLILGILSDVFDGIVARRLKISTDRLRKWDSNVDAVFLVSNIIAGWLLFPEIIEAKWGFILTIVALELICYFICLLRFKKLPANHTYSSKLFAVFICICLTTLFVTGNWGIIFPIMFCIGVIAYIDNIIILTKLSEYKVDTKVFWKTNK